MTVTTKRYARYEVFDYVTTKNSVSGYVPFKWLARLLTRYSMNTRKLTWDYETN